MPSPSSAPRANPSVTEAPLSPLVRQPVLDAKLKTIGYQLFCPPENTLAASIDDGTQATSKVLANLISEIGIDSVVGGLPAWVEFTPHFLLGELPIPLGPKSLVIEIDASRPVSERLLARLQNLKFQGYRIAIDSLELNTDLEHLAKLANIAKLDWERWDPSQRETLRKKWVRSPTQLMATNVHTWQAYEVGLREGFVLFQGSFVCVPERVQQHKVPANRVALMRLLNELYAEDPAIDRIQQLVQQDITLSFRLLKWLNSSLFALPRAVESISHALILLGLQRVRDLVSLIVLARIDDKPSVLVETALMRARIGENVARSVGLTSESMFTVGLFSVLDALMGVPMPELLKSLPLAPEVAGAIQGRDGPYGKILQGIEAHERGDWQGIERAGLDLAVLSPAWVEALVWVRNVRSLFTSKKTSDGSRPHRGG